MGDELAEPDPDLPALQDEDGVDEINIEVEEAPMDDEEHGVYTPEKFTLDRQKVFLEELAKTGNASVACECADIDYATAKYACKQSERFKKLFDKARRIAYDRLEQEAFEWATEGKVQSERYDPETGELVQKRYDYSEKMLKTLLEANRPEKFDRNDEVEHSGEIELKISPQQDSGHNRNELDDGD